MLYHLGVVLVTIPLLVCRCFYLFSKGKFSIINILLNDAFRQKFAALINLFYPIMIRLSYAVNFFFLLDDTSAVKERPGSVYNIYQKIYCLASRSQYFYVLFFIPIYKSIGPWFFDYVIDDHMGIYFAWGVYFNWGEKFCPAGLTYLSALLNVNINLLALLLLSNLVI